LSALAQGTSSNSLAYPARIRAVVTMLVARPPPGMPVSVKGGQLSDTRRSLSCADAAGSSITVSNPTTQSSGRMLKSFRN
jgi:hypothetical protein